MTPWQQDKAAETRIMDRLQRAFYEKDFRIAFLRSKGSAFRSSSERLMSLAYKADFMACRPLGKGAVTARTMDF